MCKAEPSGTRLHQRRYSKLLADYQAAFSFSRKTIGTLTIQLPLIIYQSDAVDIVEINIPVNCSYNGVRRLQAASGVYTGPRSGVGNGVVEVKLEPYTDESGTMVGYTVTSVVSSVCLGATALFL